VAGLLPQGKLYASSNSATKLTCLFSLSSRSKELFNFEIICPFDMLHIFIHITRDGVCFISYITSGAGYHNNYTNSVTGQKSCKRDGKLDDKKGMVYLEMAFVIEM
jgi:hypothetical protein